MKLLLLYALLLGLGGCGVSSSQTNTDYKPTALDSATNGLYKARPQANHPGAAAAAAR